MIPCSSCGAELPDGAQSCTKCGTPLPPSSQSTDYSPPPSSSYTPTGGAGTYNQSTSGPLQYQPSSQPHQPVPEPVHPALPAIVSLLFPGAGMFFVPDKASLAAILLISWICWLAIVITLSFFMVGLCLFPVSIIIHVVAALYSYDAAAKASGGKYAPLVFKG